VARGRFITLEGGEGAGKSTQISLLAAHLRTLGIEVVETREPGGAPGAERIRELLIDGPTDRWDGVTEALLHFAARREHVGRTILPALERGAWVVCDRFADSTRAYQGYGLGVAKEVIETLYRQTVGSLKPDLTVILDLPVEEGLRRAGQRRTGGTRYERMDAAFHMRMRDGFLEIARAEPERCAVIDATGSIETVAADIQSLVDTRLTPAAG
jgi:dTMP kinase